MNVKNTLVKTLRTLGSPKFATGLMVVVATFQLVQAINAVLEQDKKVGFRKDR